MNYLGHLYFSGNDVERMQANLYGDFVKGSHLDHLPAAIREGVQLHRKIDDFIDHHPLVHELLVLLRPDLPKVAGVAVDIYFDHLLARNWKQFHPQDLQEYLDYIYLNLDFLNPFYSSDYRSFLQAMVRYNWISHYHTTEGLDKMCRGVSSKLSFPNALVNGSAVFRKHELQITECFFEYMIAANEYFLREDPRILS